MSDNTPKRDINYKRHTARYRARRRAADILYEAENRDVDPVAIVVIASPWHVRIATR